MNSLNKDGKNLRKQLLRATWRGAWPDNKVAVATFSPPTLFVPLHDDGRLINAVNFTRFMAIMQMTEPGKGAWLV